MSKRKNKKGPQLITAALLVAFPVLCGQAAMASTSSALGIQQSQGVLRTPLQELNQRQTKNYQYLGPQSAYQSPAFFSQTEEEYQTQLNKATQKLSSAEATLASATQKLNLATTKKDNAQEALDKAQDALDSAKDKLDTAKDDIDSAQAEVDSAQATLDTAKADLDAATQDKQNADAAVGQQEQIRNDAQVALDTAQTNLTAATSNLQIAQNTRASAQANLTSKQSAYTQAQQATLAAQAALQNAQANYNLFKIPDPNWTAPTQQVARTRTVPRTETVYTTTLVPTTTTTLQEQVITNLLFNSDFSRGNEGWSGLSIGWQNSQPGYFNSNIVFSYINQTVTQGLYSGPFNNSTLTLSADWYNDDSNRNITDSYSMTVTAQDIDRNPVGSATFTSNNTRHDWESKSVVLTATGPVSFITVEFSGIDNGYWLGNYGPHMKNPALRVSHGEYVTQTTYEEVTTSEQVTTMVQETYYTTEVVQPQQGLTVKVYNNLPTANPQRSDNLYNLCLTTTLTSIQNNWGGGNILGCGNDRVMIHYTGYITPTENVTYLMNQADDGFYMDLNGSNVINNWTLKGCGGNWNSVNLQAGQSYAIDAWFYEWGGGACSTLFYQSANGQGVVPDSWYSNGASAPLIYDPALLLVVQTTQTNLTSAQQAEVQAQQNVAAATAASSTSTQAAEDKQDEVNEAQTSYDAALETFTNEAETLAALESTKTTNHDSYDDAVAAYEDAQNSFADAQDSFDDISSDVDSAKEDYDAALESFKEAETTFNDSDADLTSAQTNVEKAQDAVDIAQDELDSIPTYVPPEEEEEKIELPPLEDLTKVNFEEIVATDLTKAQAEEIKEAALETFKTAEQGSPAYEAALEALFVAAQQNDITVDPALAEIPGVGVAVVALADAINFLGNAGADMSPQVREESEKVVVTAVVAGNAAIAAAASSAASAAAATSSGGGGGASGGSSSGRRIK